jgi:hypothetical protein
MAATKKTIEMEVRFRRLWLLELAFKATGLVRRVCPVSNRLIDWAARQTRVDTRQAGQRDWRTTGSLNLVPCCGACDCTQDGGCACTDWSAARLDRS